jgi:hypothetical protein
MDYKVESPNGKSERFTNRRKADKRARELSRMVSGVHYLAVLKYDSPESHPQGRWDAIETYCNGAVTLYR